MTENKDKSLKEVVDTVVETTKKKSDELYNTPLSQILKDKHGGINILPIIGVLLVIIVILVINNE
jgi:hypothetical protein